jgi:hypothetical protein
MVKFEFKWTNQELTTHYRPPAPMTGGSADAIARSGSNTGGTARSVRMLPLPPGPMPRLLRQVVPLGRRGSATPLKPP